MIFEHGTFFEKLGEKIGFIFSYFLFTTILYFILGILHRLPVFWSYFHMMGVTLILLFIGIGVKRLLR